MRIIDKTPFITPEGKINPFDRLRGTLQYGFSWYPDLQAQQTAIRLLDKHLDKKYTLIRNQTLGNSQIVLPLTLIGPDGIHVIYVTHVSGMFRAKGDIWGELSGSKFKAASINLLKRTFQFGRVLDVYFKKQGFDTLPAAEAVLMSVNPKLHIDTVRPIVRVIMSDGVQRFASSLIQAPPVLSVEMVHKLAEALQHPHSAKKAEAQEQSLQDEFAFREEAAGDGEQSPLGSASEIREAFDAGEAGVPAFTEAPAVPRPAVQPRVPARTRKVANSYLGMTGKQFAVLGAMAAVFVCILIVFILLILIQTPRL